jgi:hypothetical protein
VKIRAEIPGGQTARAEGRDDRDSDEERQSEEL